MPQLGTRYRGQSVNKVSPSSFDRALETYLFIDRVAISKNEIASQEARDNGIVLAVLPSVRFSLNQQQGLINRDEFGEVESMLFRCAVNQLETRFPTDGATFECVENEGLLDELTFHVQRGWT